MKRTIFVFLSVLLIVASCKKDSGSGNPVQKNKTVEKAIEEANMTVYEGDTPPSLEGLYSTKNMLFKNSTSNLSWTIGLYMNSTVKFYDQTDGGDIMYCERMAAGGWYEGVGCYITGSGNSFTIWMEIVSASNGNHTAFIISGQKDEASGNLVNCQSMTVYLEATTSYEKGDWYYAEGWLESLNTVVGTWTKTSTAVDGSTVNWEMTLASGGQMTYFTNGGAVCGIMGGTWSVTGNLITIYDAPHSCNNYNGSTHTSEFTLYNDASSLHIDNCYIFDGYWQRKF